MIETPEMKDGENWESDNYDAGFNESCEDWQSYHSQEIAKKDKEISELVEALIWCGEHSYAGGKSFKDVEPVKSALNKHKTINE